MREGCKYISHNAQLLIEGEGQRGFLDVLAKRLSLCIFRHKHKIGAVFTGKEVANVQDVGVTRNLSNGTKGVTDDLLFLLARSYILVRINMVDAQAGSTTLADECMARPILVIVL